MKQLHLLCNAHLDPAWLWQRREGLAEALSTFRVAADFCEKYDGFVFNHNEALLYEWTKEYDPQLFARIQKLVKAGKWVIMGGWYLQPDCVMTSGESLLAQARLGLEFFEENFGVRPKTAINFDPFGHSRGLVQILKAVGYSGYLFMRPNGKFRGDFWWEGFDGSRIHAHGMYGAYGTLKGQALKKIREDMALIDAAGVETGLCLWGIGNHGGGPSMEDLEQINAYIKHSDVQILHSDADTYMAQADKTELPVVRESLIPFAVGCYTSMVQIKQANRRVENKLAVAEKISTYAGCYDRQELTKARKALAFCQFHDVLPGSSIKAVEEDSLRTLGYAEEIADRLCDKAFFRLCAGQKKAEEGTVPIMIFNPHPYEIEGVFEAEFLLQSQNWTDGENTVGRVFDSEGKEIPTQNEKPRCTLNLDWVKRVSFFGKLQPAGITRFDCRLSVRNEPIYKSHPEAATIEVCNDRMRVKISRQTGLIEEYTLDGKTYVQNSGELRVYNDNEDPWGMTVDRFAELAGTFRMMSREEANSFVGYSEETYPAVRIVEDGEVRTKAQAFFICGASRAVVEYTLPKHGTYLDVDITIHSNEPCRMIKYRLDTLLCGVPWGETAFGSEELYRDGAESVYHKWCAIKKEEDSLYVLNRGTYGGSFSDSVMELSLLRTPVYAAHPIPERPTAPHDRYCEHMDLGERKFSFRITADHNAARQAQIFNESPIVLSFFPSGEGQPQPSVVTVEAPEVILSSVREEELVLHNTSGKQVKTCIRRYGREPLELVFEPFELKIL